MSLQVKTSELTNKVILTQNQDNIVDLSTQNPTTQENAENEQLIKPIPINIKLIKRSKSDITTMGDSTLTIKPIVKELKMPFMFPNYNYPNIPEYNSSLGDNYIHKKDSDENNSITYKKEKSCCSCTKTRCIKKYCECFANHNYCIDCHCKNCMNKYIDYNAQNCIKLNEYENEKINCTCSKSNCNKKYCECFKIGKKCNGKCRCLNCLNMKKNVYNNNDNYSGNNNHEININQIIKDNNLINDILYKNNKNDTNSEEKKLISSKSSECENIYDTFKIQRISVFINKYQTSINVEKLSKEE